MLITEMMKPEYSKVQNTSHGIRGLLMGSQDALIRKKKQFLQCESLKCQACFQHRSLGCESEETIEP